MIGWWCSDFGGSFSKIFFVVTYLEMGMYSDIDEQIFPGWQKMKHLTRTLLHLFCSLTFHRLLFTPRMTIAVVMFFVKQRLLPFTHRIMIWKKRTKHHSI